MNQPRHVSIASHAPGGVSVVEALLASSGVRFTDSSRLRVRHGEPKVTGRWELWTGDGG